MLGCLPILEVSVGMEHLILKQSFQYSWLVVGLELNMVGIHVKLLYC